MTWRRWINATTRRYDQVELVRDLLGDWTVVQCWGGLGSRLGQRRIRYVPSQAAGLEHIDAISTQRRRRGYILIESRRDPCGETA